MVSFQASCFICPSSGKSLFIVYVDPLAHCAIRIKPKKPNKHLIVGKMPVGVWNYWICWSGPWAFYFLFGWWRFSFVFLLCFVTSIWLACCGDLWSFFFFVRWRWKRRGTRTLWGCDHIQRKKRVLCTPSVCVHFSYLQPRSGSLFPGPSFIPRGQKKKIGIAISAFGERWDSGKSKHPSSSFSVLFFARG